MKAASADCSPASLGARDGRRRQVWGLCPWASAQPSGARTAAAPASHLPPAAHAPAKKSETVLHRYTTCFEAAIPERTAFSPPPAVTFRFAHSRRSLSANVRHKPGHGPIRTVAPIGAIDTYLTSNGRLSRKNKRTVILRRSIKRATFGIILPAAGSAAKTRGIPADVLRYKVSVDISISFPLHTAGRCRVLERSRFVSPACNGVHPGGYADSLLLLGWLLPGGSVCVASRDVDSGWYRSYHNKSGYHPVRMSA
jgi:hypothetical protein